MDKSQELLSKEENNSSWFEGINSGMGTDYLLVHHVRNFTKSANVIALIMHPAHNQWYKTMWT